MSERRPNPSDPTAERTSEQTTPGASGPTGGRPDMEEGRRDDDADDPISRGPEDNRAMPRRYDEDERDPVMPTDDARLGTKL